MNKKIIFFVMLLMVLMVFNSKSVKADDCLGGLTSVSVINLQEGQNITFTDPVPPNNQITVFSGLIGSTVDGNPTKVYCVDLHRNVQLPNNDYTDTCSYAAPRIQWILDHYFPYNPSYPGKLDSNNMEAAAIDAVIWSYTDNVDVTTITDVTIRNRAIAIKNDADLNGFASQPIITFSLHAGTEPNDFYVKTLNENGQPIAVDSINLSITDGSLNTVMTATDGTGKSPNITVEFAGFDSKVRACAKMLFPQGRIMQGIINDKQSLTLAIPVFGRQCVEIEWGALPVEMSLFTSTVNGRNVILNWTTVSETNNSGFDVERKISGTESWTKVGNVVGNGNSTVTNNYSYADVNLSAGQYSYRLKQIDYNGNFEYFNLNSEVNIGIPTKYSLSQNYPNPFNPTTKINFSIPENGMVTLKLFNLAGKEVMTLVNEEKPTGHYSVELNGSNLSTGVYYYRLSSGNFTHVKKMTLIK